MPVENHAVGIAVRLDGFAEQKIVAPKISVGYESNRFDGLQQLLDNGSCATSHVHEGGQLGSMSMEAFQELGQLGYTLFDQLLVTLRCFGYLKEELKVGYINEISIYRINEQIYRISFV